MMNDTLNYYNENAEKYAETTRNADMHYAYQRFEEKLSRGAKILDLGCGSGRDSRYFKDKGYDVSAADGSEGMAREASAYTGLDVKVMDFHDLDAEEEYDAIWACASLLHVPYEELDDVFARMMKAIKKEGVIYMSFKYGTAEETRGGRSYTDMDLNRAAELITPHRDALLLECWKSHDVMKREEMWLNMIIRKVTKR